MSAEVTNRKGEKVRVNVTDRDGNEVNPGDWVTDFRGDAATFQGIERFGGTGTAKVLVKWPDAARVGSSYNAAAFGLTVQGEHDEEWLAAQDL